MRTGLILHFLVIGVVGRVAGANDWPQWLGPNRDGISTERIAGGPSWEPRALWRGSVGVGVSSVVVSQGRAFTLGHIRGPQNRGIDTVYCFDAGTGDVIWKYSYDCLSCYTQDVRFFGPRPTPTVDGDVVFTLSLEGHLFCFEAASGKIVWSKNLPADLKGRIPVYGYCCSPLVYGGKLILELNGEGATYVALDKSTAAVKWKLAGGYVTGGSPVVTRIDGVDTAVFMGGGAVVGLNAETGAELWRHSTWGHAWTGPVVFGNKIFVANASLPRGCGMISVDHGKPTVVWEDRKRFQTLHCNSVIWQGHIYGFDNTGTDYQGKDSKKSSLKCLELDTGSVKWVKERMGWGNLIICDGRLIVLRETGELVIAQASPEKYREFCRTHVFGGQSWTVPALAGGKLYCRNNSGDVVCLEFVGQAAPAVSQKEPVAESVPAIRSGKTSSRIVPKPDRTGSEARAASFASGTMQRWPRFRGPGGSGIAPFAGIPVSIDPKTGKAVLWKTVVPLEGQSSPVVWENRVFLTGAGKGKCEVYCFDADSGRLAWQREVAVSDRQDEAKAKDSDILLAASTPVVDGSCVYAIFGSGDVTCLNFEGTIVWTRSLGMPENTYGHAASLEICGDLLIVQLDQASAEDGKSKILALDLDCGETVWETKREAPASWSTPIVISAAARLSASELVEAGSPKSGREQIVTCADPWVIAYDPTNGAEIWKVKCLGGDVVPSPIFVDGLVYAVSADGVLAAIDPNGHGDVTDTRIVWVAEDNLPPICSPVSNGGLVWLVDSAGIVTCYDARDGKKLWERELGDSFQASPNLVGDLLYLLSDNGILFVLKAGREYQPVSRIELREPCQASPAFGPGRMYVRTKSHLYCFGNAGR